MKVEFTVPGVPVGKGRPRFMKNGHTYTPEKTRGYEDKVVLCWKFQSYNSFAAGVPLIAHITAYFPVPKSASKAQKAAMEGKFHMARPDADNICKTILDALNQHAYPDDSAVQIGGCYKIYTNGSPRVEVTIEEAE